MTARLKIGVIGLGRLWEARHKPALAKLRDRFQVVAVYDQVARRAAIEAAVQRCEVATGIRALVERKNVDAVYLLTPQWFGLHPVEAACECGKPIYCALPPARDSDDLESAALAIRSSGVVFMPELARRFYPATLRLRELLANNLGPARLILGHTRLFGFDRYGSPGPSNQLAPVPLTIDPGSYLLDWCRYLFQSEPTRITGQEATALHPVAVEESGADFAVISLAFSDHRAAQIEISRYHRATWGDATRFLPAPGFQVYAERGVAWLEMPDRIQWSDSGGLHDERLPMEPTVGELLNDQFHRLVHGEPSVAPTLEDALVVARLNRELQRSLQDHRGVPDA